MKISIELTANEVKGIKEYLADTSNDINPKITAADVKEYIQGVVSTTIYAPSECVSDYIKKS